MKKISRVLFVFVAVVMVLALLGCGGGGGRNALFGKWEMSESGISMIWEFTSDGKLNLDMGLGIPLELSYTFVDDDTVQLNDPTGTMGNLAMDWKVNGDKLDLTAEGQTVTLTRVK